MIWKILDPIKDYLEYDEAVQVIAKGQNRMENSQNLDDLQSIKEVIEGCCRFPLAIILISGLQLSSSQDWNNIKTLLESQDRPDRMPVHKFNLFAIITQSIQQLETNEQNCFYWLGVFKRVSIPIGSIAALWNYNKQDTFKLIFKLRDKSLLKYVENGG